MDKFVFLEHTADVLFESSGFSFEEAFENAGLAMFSTIAKTELVGETDSFELDERAETIEELVTYALSDLLAESEARELYLKKIQVLEYQKNPLGHVIKLRATGAPVSEEAASSSVKAVTHHECRVEKDGNIWKIRVLLDV